jgi:hypothetical protein
MGNDDGVIVMDGVGNCVGVWEHEPTMSAVAPALQQRHTPEQALVESPVVAPYVPAGQGSADDEARGQYDPAGLQDKNVRRGVNMETSED